MFNCLKICSVIFFIALLLPALVFARPSLTTPVTDLLTAQERQWISEHPVVNVRISRDYSPFEFYEDGQFQGYAVDYLNMLGERLGLKFQPTPDMPWEEALQRIEQRQGVDLILLVTQTVKRESFLLFTSDFISFPEVIFTRKDHLFVSGSNDLIGRTVATENGFISVDSIRRDIFQVNILEVRTTEQALKSVALGEADAYIGNLAVGSFLIDKLGLVGLKVAASTDYDDDSYAMGIRKDWPELKSILQKGLDSFSTEEHQQLRQKWFVLNYEHGFSYADILSWVIAVMLAASAIIIYHQRVSTTKVRESEERFRRIIEDQTEFIVRWLPDGIRTFVNDSYCRYFRQTRKELIGTSFLPTVSTEHRAKVEQRIASLTPENPVISGEHKVVLPNGETSWQAWTDRAIFDANGKLVEYQSVGRDITEKRLAEQLLKNNEEYFRTIFQACPDTIVLVRTEDSMIMDFNDVALNTYGFNRDEVPEEASLLKLNFWDDPEERKLFVNELKQRGRVDNFAARLVSRKGEKITALVSARVLDYKGEACHLAFIKDISILQEANDALKDSEKMYRRLSQEFEAVLDGIVDSIVLIDPERKVVWGNHGASMQFRCSPQELISKTCDQLWKSLSREDCVESVAQIFDVGQSIEVVKKDDEGRTWGVKGYPVFDNRGKVQNVILIASDLTEKIQLREEAARSAHLAAIGSLSAGIAHEINNPTGTIMRSMAIIHDVLEVTNPILEKHADHAGDFDIYGIPYSELKDDLMILSGDVRNSAEQIKRIVDDLKSFSQPTREGNYKLFDLTASIKKVVRLMHNTIKNHTENFSLEMATDLPQCFGSSPQIEQVLTNLLQNACQALENREQAIRIWVTYAPYDNVNIIEVNDEGKGIAPSIMAKIREPFFTTRRDEGGTGLGLSISSRIVNEHKGSLDITSTPGGGTTVWLKLSTQEDF